MNIILISRCNKNALIETRRILDQFAERKGDRVWQTPITLEGLKTLRMLLKKTARRNTAVACHWVRGRNQTELMWIAGNIRRFNQDGTAPTNRTTRSFVKNKGEDLWQNNQSIAILAGLAGLFHDLGKGNKLFQTMISGGGGYFQPYRHEWLSFLIFISFTENKNDKDWLKKLEDFGIGDAIHLLQHVDLHKKSDFFSNLAPIAKTVAWLIVSHHRLPAYPRSRGNQPELKHIPLWLKGSFNVAWNAENHLSEWSAQQSADIHTFPNGIAVASHTWQQKAGQLAKRARQCANLAEFGCLDQPHTIHLTRMVLMLADHCYSAGPALTKWQDPNHESIANTDNITGEPRQKLDEHCVGVAHNSYLMGIRLGKLRQFLPAISRHKGFKKRTKPARFQWQNKAYDLACGVRKQSSNQGFFGINMASTGCGKTFANGRIMYGLANEQEGCRFSVALGLRTLTLQTGDALRERLHLDEDDLAVLIGSQAVKKLHETGKNNDHLENKKQAEQIPIDPEPEEMYVSYDGRLDDGYLVQWLANRPKIHSLVSAPITVSTIDYLISATEGIRGGKQIGPMLRLLTSDLVLDEPDDLGLNDLKGLSRLVHWAGMLGSRILISSATIAPVLVDALFEAYSAGRKEYAKSNGSHSGGIVTAWFDEFSCMTQEVVDRAELSVHHKTFITKRQRRLQKKLKVLRRGALVPLAGNIMDKRAACFLYASKIQEQALALHAIHHQKNNKNQTVSVGLVRMANIEPLIATGLELLVLDTPENYGIHYCFYHSKHPLAVRSMIERRLDGVLMRNGDDLGSIFSQSDIADRLKVYPEEHHIFVVLATAVAEVGRDHDYDWAIVEPSSVRSIIQLAGRVQRHRQQEVREPNVAIFSKNIKALCGEKYSYSKPGFQVEKQNENFPSDLQETLLPEDYEIITARPRFLRPEDSKSTFVQLEHSALIHNLFTDDRNSAAFWWQKESKDVHLFGEMQRQQRFRKSNPTTDYYLFAGDEGNAFKVFDSYANHYAEVDMIQPFTVPPLGRGVGLWFTSDITAIYEDLEEKFDMDLDKIAEQFGVLSLEDDTDNQITIWNYHPFLGAFRGRYLE